MSKAPEMSPVVAADLVKTIKDSWKKYRSRPHKAPEEIIIEAYFLHEFIRTGHIEVKDDGTGKITVFTYGRAETYECHRFIITGENGKDLYFHYFGGKGPYRGVNYGLIIVDKDNNVIYWREAGQNPRTEWLINCLAENLEDENGKFVFTGEPVTI